MKISLNWLQDYVALDASVDEIAHAITFLGFEVEQVLRTGAPPLRDVVVGEVLTREKHPNADKLTVCTVDVGPAGGVKTIVCGAQNHKVGDRVPVALPGAVLPGNFTIKQSKIRGQLSDGMMCSPENSGSAATIPACSSSRAGPRSARPSTTCSRPATSSSTSKSPPTGPTACATSAWRASWPPGSAGT